MKHYAKMPDETTERVARLLKLYHPEVAAAGVRIDLLSVVDGKDGPALKLHGYACDAVVRATNVKERTKGAGDVEIVFDEARYMAMNEAQRDGLCDHELEHIELKIDAKTDRVKLDCLGRPKVGMKKHDAQFGWFKVIAERHGQASGECEQAAAILLDGAQSYFAFHAVKYVGAGEAPKALGA